MAVTPLFPGAVGAARPDWPMIGFDPEHSASAPGPEPPYRVTWRTPVPQAMGGPVVTDGAVVVVGGRNVMALETESGDVLWEQERTEGAAGTPAVTGSLVVHSSGAGETAAMVARRLENGIEVWRAFTEGEAAGGVTVADGRVYVGTRGGLVLALDARTGEEQWRFEAPGQVTSSPAVSDGRVVIVAQDREGGRATVAALDAESGADAETGDPLWSFSPVEPSLGASSAAIADGRVFVGMGNARVYALDLGSGDEVWSVRSLAGFGAQHVPAAPDDVFVADIAGLLRLDPDTGLERWSYRLTAFLQRSSPARVGDAVVIGDEAGLAAAIDVDSGLLVWKRDVGTGAIGAPAVSPDRVYLTSQGEDGAVVALEHDPNGSLLSEPSPTVLFPGQALLNFLEAMVLVGAGSILVFRYLVRPRGDREAEGEGG